MFLVFLMFLFLFTFCFLFLWFLLFLSRAFLLKVTQTKINPLTPRSDYHETSPIISIYYPIQNSPNLHYENHLVDSKEN